MKKADAAKRKLERLLEAARDAGPRLDWALSGGLGLAALLLYLRVRNALYSFDAVAYAEVVENGTAQQLLHPHHVLYNPICRLAYAVARLLGYDGRALGPMHFLNALAGAVGVAFTFLVCRKLGASRTASLLAGLAVATAAAYWANAAGVEVYTLGTAAALVGLYAAAQVPSRGTSAATLAGAACAGAALIQQLNILLAPAAFIYVLTTGAARRQKALAFAGGYAGAFVLGYVVLPAAFLRFEGAGDYVEWFFSYARMKRWGGFSWPNVAAGADAFARVFYVNAFWDNFAAPFIKKDVRHLRVALPLWLGVAFCGANLWLRLTHGPERRALILVAVSFLTYTGFILWWLPRYVGYWLFPAATFAAAVAVASSKRGRRWHLISLIALTLAWLGITNVNWRDGISRLPDLQANADYRAGLAVSRIIPEDALAYLANSPAVTYARYFGGVRRVRSPNWVVNACRGDGEKAARHIEKLIRGEFDDGRAVYVGERAFPGIGGPPLRELGERLLAEGRAVGSYAGADVSEIIYVITPGASGF
ncbi:MAG: DUF2723 domain-containing protein [candidate division Zixibacteria bacterium]|nr:DUF2723 domain-containing protein [candidate division Zixibacteria bacterium]